MKRAPIAFTISCLCLTLIFAHEMTRDTAAVQLGNGKVTIEYGTPKLKGRNLDEMIKPGMAWRMGMDNPTTLETTIPLHFGENKTLQPGKYTLFARPDEKKNWTLLISSGSAASLNPSTVVLEAPLHFMKDDKPEEALKITLDKARESVSLLVAWGTYRLHGSFKAAA